MGSYVCAIADQTAQPRSTDFQLRAVAPPRGSEPAHTLACTPVTPLPYVLELLRKDGVVPLGRAGLTLEVARGDLVGGEPVLRGTPRP